MSDFILRERMLKRLRAAYPVADGWRLVECDASGIRIALKFLQRKHPQLIISDRTIPVSRGKYERDHDAEGTLAEAVGKVEFENANWSGELEIEWENERIVMVRVPVDFEYGRFECTSFIVAKNQKVAERFRAAVLVDELNKEKESEMIRVIGGKDIPRPKVSWDQVFLPQGMVDTIRSTIDSFFLARSRYKELGVSQKRGLLFMGPPGNGKTQTIRAIAANFKVPMINVQVTSTLEERDIEYSFALAEDISPCILVFEDLDKIFHQSKVSLSYVLNKMDGLDGKQGSLIIATTNEPGKVDPALLHRPSRFDRIFEFPLPDYSQRLKMLSEKGGKLFPEELLIKCAEETVGFSGAYVQELLVNALLSSISARREPSPQDLLNSLQATKEQHKAIGKVLGNNGNGDLGFHKSAAGILPKARL